jgi:ribonuclease BN (tRNA processing enzyme)
MLGCHGAQLPSFNTTCFLVGQNVLIDGGTITSALNLKEQIKIDYIFVTHAHLDHVCEIMFLADNNYYQYRGKPLIIVSTKGVIIDAYIITCLIMLSGLIFLKFPTRKRH